MKVIVRCANNRITKADMEREIERLFQENKDLRLSESHLRDELNIVSQQSEVRRQKIVEKDTLIDELNDQITAQEEELNEVHKTLDKKTARLSEVCAQRDNFEASYKQVTQWWENEQTKARKAEERAEEYRIALMESDCRVDELEKQLEWVRGEVKRLTYERNTAVNGNAELIEENVELRENLDAATNIRIEYAQEIDRLRKVVTNLQSTRFTTDEFLRMIARELMPSTGNDFVDSVDF